MNTSTIYIADENKLRANHLIELLGEVGFSSRTVSSPSEIRDSAGMLIIAGDAPEMSGSDSIVRRFADVAPRAPIVVISEHPLWDLIRMAVRNRAWMDVPRSERYDDIMNRIATLRVPCPRIIMDDSIARCNQLLTQWSETPFCESELVQADTLGEALEMAVDGRASVLLNLSISPSAVQSPGISTLIYSLSPTVIAIMVESGKTRRPLQNFTQLESSTRFAVLQAPFHTGDIKTLVNTMNVNWSVTSPP